MSLGRAEVLKSLTGMVCLYKPPDISTKFLKYSFANKILKDLNDSYRNPPYTYLEFEKNETDLSVNIRPSYADTVLASGPKYTNEDISLALTPMGSRSSGVCVLGINNGINHVLRLQKCNFLKVLQVKGMLGQVTRFLYKNEPIVARASFRRVQRKTLDNAVSSFQAAHQRKTYIELGIDLQSQEAYEYAVQGMLRPHRNGIPTIYTIRCIEFELPEFTLEIHCLNENENYLLNLIYELGLSLRTVAHCTGIRCIRYGPFTVEHALADAEWSLSNVKKNIKICEEIMQKTKVRYFRHLKPPADIVKKSV